MRYITVTDEKLLAQLDAEALKAADLTEVRGRFSPHVETTRYAMPRKHPKRNEWCYHIDDVVAVVCEKLRLEDKVPLPDAATAAALPVEWVAEERAEATRKAGFGAKGNANDVVATAHAPTTAKAKTAKSKR